MNKDSLLIIILLNIIIILIIILIGCSKENVEVIETGGEKSLIVTEIISGPPKITNSTDAVFEFRCSKNECLFMCKLDNNPWNECQNSTVYSGIEEGTHRFSVYAKDTQGNIENIPVDYEWTVDITPPTAKFLNKLAENTINDFISFEFSCDEERCNFECSLDSSGWAECESPVTYSSILKGTHQFSVRAKDAAGNIQSVPTQHTWNVVATILDIYPYDGEKDVSPSTNIFLVFSEPVDEGSLMNGFSLVSNSTSVAGTLQLSSDKRRAKFIPSAPLVSNRLYQVVLTSVITLDGVSLLLPNNGIVSSFTTSGYKVISGDGLRVIAIDPAPDAFYDFSTLRIIFSEPLDPLTVIQGTSFSFKKVSTNTEVPGKLIVNGNKIIFDPDEDLIGGEEYLLTLTSGIKGKNGENLSSYTQSIYPVPTIAIMSLKNITFPDIDDANGDPALLPVSFLSGERVNSSIIESKLLGHSETYLKGLLTAEIRTPLNGADILPLVMRRGQVIESTGMDVKLGGVIDTQLDTGDLYLYLITDATGYIKENPFRFLNNDAHPAVYIKLDNCITATNPTINSTLNQDLVDINLFGELAVEGGIIIIDAIGTTELNLLNAENASVTLSLRLEGTDAPPFVDTTPPSVSSIYPQGDNVPFDSNIIITFSEPVKESSLAGKINITSNNGPLSGRIRVDGSAVVFTPVTLLNNNTTYTISISQGIEDLNGNVLTSTTNSTFTTQNYTTANLQSPLIGSIYPGVPCVLKNGDSSNAGRCSVNDPGQFPIFELPVNRNIVVYFTKPINPATVNDSSFRVIDKTTSQPVPGSRVVEYTKVTFIPDESWIIGRDYELRIVGGSDNQCNTGEICGTDGRVLNTDILDDAENLSSEVPGGADIVIPFKGAPYSDEILVPLQLKRYTDVNSNGIADAGETQYNENSVFMTATAMGIPLQLRTYLSGILLTSIGSFNENENGIPLTLYPGNWIFGTNVTALIINSGRLLVRPANTVTGLIRTPDASDPDQRPVVEFNLPVWMDAVNTAYGNDCDGMMMQDFPVIMNLSGRLSFSTDGRMVTTLANTNQILANATAKAVIVVCLTLPTQIRINTGDADQQAVSLPVK